MAKKEARTAPVVPSDIMIKLTAKCAELRDIELEKSDLEDRVSGLNKRIYAIQHEELPDLMADAGVDKLGIPAEGNHPAQDLALKPFYQANIAAGWDEEKRAAAFAYLESIGAGDLIKTTIIVSIPREDRAKAIALKEQLKDFTVEVKEAVHTATLTSWLKETREDGEEVNLDLIGGQVGTIVKPKPRKS